MIIIILFLFALVRQTLDAQKNVNNPLSNDKWIWERTQIGIINI